MRRTLSILWLVLPWVVLGLYGALIADYARYLDSGLRYIEPSFPRAAEDVLGFGFWPTWVAFLILLAVFGALAYRSVTRRYVYFLSLTATFLLASALDYFLYQTLSQQLLK
jgi:hypothetical protein